MPDQVPESSMEEIFASIRKIISEDESKADQSQPTGPSSSADRPASNVSPLFADKSSSATAGAPGNLADTARTTSRLLESADRLLASDRHPTLSKPAETVAVRPPPGDITRSSQHFGQSRSDKTAPFARSEVTGLEQSGTDGDKAPATAARSVEQLAEDLLRPMLREWLEKNLPPLVERLVREEIARVARKRAET